MNTPRATHTKGVGIPQSPVDDQEHFGNCWAYAVAGWLESSMLLHSKNKEKLDMSEDALTYHHLAESFLSTWQDEKRQLAKLPPNEREKFRVDASTKIQKFFKEPKTAGGIGGSFFLIPKGISPEGVNPDALTLISRYGIVPESEYDTTHPVLKVKALQHKVHWFLAVNEMGNRFQKLWDEDLDEVTIETIRSRVLDGGFAFPTRPPESFHWKEKKTTPHELLAATGMDPAKFGLLEAHRPEDFEPFIQGVKQALARGLTVPFSFSADKRRREKETFGGPFYMPVSPNHGHGVLVVDFVNIGGKRGTLDSAHLANELSKKARVLDYLFMKNSWGAEGTADHEDGYYELKRGFLEGHLSSRGFGLTAVVPQDLVP